ncbi:MAG: hypothetical protein GX072_10460 [Lysinibacillus sp.]|nr:hypothetical protein [Lysinibacillus sp.]
MRPPYHYYHMPPARPNFSQRPPQFGYQPVPGAGRGPAPFPPGMPGFQHPKGSPKLDSILETANRFLATAQSFQPYIQQAAPMIKNLPALWKLYKGFQSIPSQNQGGNEGLERQRDNSDIRFDSAPRQQYTTKPSLPKIYQPPFDYDNF